nr:adenylyl-sulfate kinase [Microbacterium amylolyticum]
MRHIELALASPTRTARLTRPGLDAHEGDTLVLRDEEGTDIASLSAERVRISAAVCITPAQLGTGVAPAPEPEVIIDGTLTPRRPLGHLDQRELRVSHGFPRLPQAVLITGTVPAPGDAGWASHPGPVIVIDRGNSRHLAAAVTAVAAAERRAIVLPEPPRNAAEWAEQIVADTITVWETPLPVSPGRVLLLTGLSGSGKSTIAKLLVQRLAETDERIATLLDGDEVRQMLTAGLGFSREDRLANVRRIGWVAALVAQHGGIAVCAPIAPYEVMRTEMRDRAEQHGRFLLVHVATPLEVCEERDRKGLYAKARAGQIDQFTGISDPYQLPIDPDVTIDHTLTPDESVDRIIAALAKVDANA